MQTEQHAVEGRDFTRTVTFVPGPAHSRHRLCVLLDGEFYLDRLGALPLLTEAVAARRIPEMSFVFIPSTGPQARHETFPCNDRFARFVAEDLVRWATDRIPTISPEGNLVCGLSLSGLASAYVTLTHPKVFSAALSQSGSFWWRRNHFATLVPRHAPSASRYWLSVGDREVATDVKHPPSDMHQEYSQVVGVQSAVDALKSGSAQVRHHVFSGGHEFAPWAVEFIPALEWLTHP